METILIFAIKALTNIAFKKPDIKLKFSISAQKKTHQMMFIQVDFTQTSAVLMTVYLPYKNTKKNIS